MRNIIEHEPAAAVDSNLQKMAVVHSSLTNTPFSEDTMEQNPAREDISCLSMYEGGVTIVARLLEVVVVFLEGCPDIFKGTKKQKIISELAKLLPGLMDFFQVKRCVYSMNMIMIDDTRIHIHVQLDMCFVCKEA